MVSRTGTLGSVSVPLPYGSDRNGEAAAEPTIQGFSEPRNGRVLTWNGLVPLRSGRVRPLDPGVCARHNSLRGANGVAQQAPWGRG